MKTNIMAGALALAFSAAVMADDRLVRFDGGIGEIPVSSTTGTTTTANVVRGVSPGGQPWVISRLSADIRTDGHISVDGRGLLIAGGNSIGTNAGQSVLARLSCQVPASNPATFTAHDSGAVALDAAGDFRIDDVLSPLPPEPCNNPALLILNGTGQRWFAAGIPKQ